MRPLLALVALLAVAIGVAAITSHFHEHNTPLFDSSQADAPTPNPDDPSTPAAPPASPPDPKRAKLFDSMKGGAIQATLEIEGKGTMTLELYPKAAPKTVAHVVDLAKKDFYSGILFHRVVKGFVAQAGDPKSKEVKPEEIRDLTSEQVGEHFHLGGGGSGTNVPLEAKLPHLPNTIGLARSQAEDSGDSQFYINLNDNAPLDGKYCVFGKITSGQEVATKIAIGDRIKRFSVP